MCARKCHLFIRVDTDNGRLAKQWAVCSQVDILGDRMTVVSYNCSVTQVKSLLHVISVYWKWTYKYLLLICIYLGSGRRSAPAHKHKSIQSSLKPHTLNVRKFRIIYIAHDCHYRHQENLSVPVKQLFSLQADKLHRYINTVHNSTSIFESYYPWNNTSHEDILLWVYIMVLATAHIISCQMIRWIVNNGMEGMGKWPDIA
jgi:hypothetical protein